MIPSLLKYILFILLPTMAFSQEVIKNNVDSDYLKFQSTYEKEIYKNNVDTNRKYTNVIHPAVLPEWVFQLPSSNQFTLFSIGISDPGMEKESAFEMAKLRAISLMTLLYKSKFEILTDQYTKESNLEDNSTFTNRYTNFYQISASLLIDTSNLTVEEKHYTSFNEAIVLVSYPIQITGSDNIITNAHIFQNERQKQNIFESEEKYEYSSKWNSFEGESSITYKIHSFNNILEITSEFNNRLIEFPYYNFKYTSRGFPSRDTFPFNYTNKLNYGLWKSFLEVFLQELYFMSENPEIYFTQVGDNYVSATHNLSRESAIYFNSVKIDKIAIKNNCIFLKLSILK